MDSLQEEMIKQMSERSIGAPFIFQPNRFRKGNAIRQPADLILACNNVLIMFWMCSTSNRQKAIVHNIKQAKGWLRTWKTGQPLIGENRLKNFSIKFGDFKYIGLVSVINSQDDSVEFHPAIEKQLKVNFVISISQDVFEQMTLLGCGLIDWVQIIKYFRNEIKISDRLESNRFYATNATELIGYYQKYASQKADPESKLVGYLHYKTYKDIEEMIYHLKLSTLERKGEDVSSFFNDLSLYDLLKLLRHIEERVKFLSDKDTLGIFENLPTTYYNIVFFIAYNIHQMSKGMHQFIEYSEKIKKTGRPIFIMTITIFEGSWILVRQNDEPWSVECIIDSFPFF